MATKSINSFFEKSLGANTKNPRWSWGAYDPVTNRVFLRVWEDQIFRSDPGERVQVYWKYLGDHSNGKSEREEHLERVRAGAECFGVVCRPKNPLSHEKREIQDFDVEPLLRLGAFSEDDRFTYAVVEERVPLSYLRRAPSGHSTLTRELRSILKQKPHGQTSKEALVDARVGQGWFRSQVLALWGGQCAVTGSRTFDAIRASHIKPWRNSNDEERLDPYNGLPMVASLDALFDAGLIGFDSTGGLVISPALPESERALFGLHGRKLNGDLTDQTKAYLAFHLSKVFRQA